MDSSSALDQASDHSMKEPVVLYKHSALCGLSFRARREIARLADADDPPPVYEVVVQEARAVSNQIERWLGIRHESPQVIVLHQRRPVFNASHRRVTARAVRDAINNIAVL
ncbi:MAG: bacillithiol system redox-active protein YtxJ [Rhodothermales bacterium]